MKHQRRKRFTALAMLLVGVTAISYLGSFRGEFIFDDYDSIVANQDLHSLRFSAIRSTYGVTRQVVAYSVAMNYWWGGLDPFGYHVVNLLIHVAASLVVFDLTGRLIARSTWACRSGLRGERLSHAIGWISFGAAVIFALHPLQTSAVTYIIQRMESLAALFYLLTLLAAVRGFRSPRSRSWNIASLVCFCLAIFSKEHAITAPAVLLILDRSFLSRRWSGIFAGRWRLYVAYCIPLAFMLTLLSPKLHLPKLLGLDRVEVDLSEDLQKAQAIAENDAEKAIPIVEEVRQKAERVPDATVNAVRGISPSEFMSNQPRVLLHYLWLYVVPSQQCFDYQWQPRSLGTSLVVSALVILPVFVGCIVAVLLPGRLSPKAQVAAIGLAFFAIHSPRCTFQVLDLAVEYRMYLPIATLAPLTALLVFQSSLCVRKTMTPERTYLIVLSLAAILMARQTIQRNELFQSRLEMWSDCVAKSPLNARARRTLAGALAKEGRHTEALAEIQAAVELLQESYLQQIEPGLVYRSLGSRHFDLGAFRDAEVAYLQAFKLNPGLPSVYWGLADIERENGDPKKAQVLTEYGNTLSRYGT
ncbi:MAG: tetratricopeptide repeat protein [Planctomycetota bacterium]